MKSPLRRRTAIAALLLAPALTACGFSAQTDQVYQPAVGVNDRSGDVDILNALIVSGEDGSGTFAGTLVNKDTTQDATLDTVSGPGITASRTTVDVPAAGNARLAESGDLTLEGSSIKPGTFVELTFSFSNGQTTTMKVPVVEATGDYQDVPLPSASPTSSKSPKSSPSSSPSATATQ
ncbi:hypothetical protein [Nocardioides pocheonensis]|uniref:Copper chaperone PCu(A)C n=1 Tax=Nocardioides pocheonensis TaxID=661485 RepID=A0A3N0GY08_9ACTN|nr:hypothetical protein [Nocardioides pocheonensis]RNM17337.1 hypothetical protein EFL26_00670 [Nocardioides pocheonensis]